MIMHSPYAVGVFFHTKLPLARRNTKGAYRDTPEKKEDTMALEWLKTILGTSYTDALDAQIAQEIGKGFVARADFNAKNEELKQAKAQLATHEQQFETLKAAAGATDELKTQIAALQEQNAKDKAAHAAEIDHLRLDTAVDGALVSAGAKNLTAVKALLAGFLKDAKTAEDGTVRGLSAEIDALVKAEATAFLFDPPGKPPVIKGMKPGEAADNGQAGGEANPFAEKTLDLEAQAKLFKTNPEMAKALAKQAGVKFI